MAEEQALDFKELLEEGLDEYTHGLMAGAAKLPFVSIEEDNRSTKSLPDLSQKYRKVKPASSAPAARPPPLPTRSPSLDVEQPLSPSPKAAPTAVMIASDVHITNPLSSERDGDYESDTSTDTGRESSKEKSTPKTKAKITPKRKGAPVAKAKGKDTTKAKAKTKNGAKAVVAKAGASKPEDLTEMGKRLNESTRFEPTAAFRRKAGVAVNAEEKRMVGIEEQGPLDEPKSTPSKKRKRPSAADWDAEFPGLTSEVPEDGGLDDEQLISMGTDESYTTKTRWAEAPYVWNKKGLLYDRYKHLVDAKDNAGNYKWPDKVAKSFLGMSRETWRSIRQNGGFFKANGAPRRRNPKQLVPVRGLDGKFKQAADTQEGREIQAATRYELIYNKLINSGDASMKRMRNARKKTETFINEAVASNVASQKWGKEMADTWHAVNQDFLQFKEAAVKKIMELENKIQGYETRDASAQTILTHEGCGPTHTPTPQAQPNEILSSTPPRQDSITHEEITQDQSPRRDGYDQTRAGVRQLHYGRGPGGAPSPTHTPTPRAQSNEVLSSTPPRQDSYIRIKVREEMVTIKPEPELGDFTMAGGLEAPQGTSSDSIRTSESTA